MILRDWCLKVDVPRQRWTAEELVSEALQSVDGEWDEVDFNVLREEVSEAQPRFYKDREVGGKVAPNAELGSSLFDVRFCSVVAWPRWRFESPQADPRLC